MRWLHACATTASLTASAPIGESLLFIGNLGLRFVRVLVLLAVWRSVLGGRGAAGGLSLATVLTYTLLSEAFAAQLNPTTSLAEHLWVGSIATRFLRPLGVVAQFSAEMVGSWVVPFLLCSVPLLIVAPLLGVSLRPAGSLPLFVVSLAMASVVGVAVDFGFATLGIHLGGNVWFVNAVRAALTSVVSGALIPLQLLPWHLGDVVQWLPLASVTAAPLRVYTGSGSPSVLLLTQLGWAVVMWLVVWRSWRASRDMLVGYGG